MYAEILVYAKDPAAVRKNVIAAGGRLVHALTAQLLVLSIPDGLDGRAIAGASAVDPGQLQGTERALAEVWLSKFGAVSRAAERQAKATAPAIPWDTPGFTPPNRMPGRPGPDQAAPDSLSTGAVTSVMLTGSVAVGLIMVSGPQEPPPWIPIHGALRYVSVGADGTVWGVNAGGQPFRLSGSQWTAQPGRLSQISVGNAGTVWAVNSANKVFRWNGDAWDQVAGALKHVSAANDGSVWGVNRNDEIFRWTGSGWEQVSGRLKQVSVGNRSTTWGVNADDEIFSWNGSGWTRVAGALKHVSVAADGSIFGVNTDHEIFTWNSAAWVQLAGRLTQISASSASVAWGVNKDDEIYIRRPSSRLAFTEPEKAQIMGEVLEALTFLASADLDANVSFVQDWRDVTVDVAAGAGHDYEDFEAPWRNAALKAMGFTASRQGSVDFAKALWQGHETDRSYVAYFTRYPLHHFAYAAHERAVMHYENDNWGPSQLNRVFAHETCHLFGAADEYGDCDCDGSGHHDVPNNNCKHCTTAQVPCLMDSNELSLCAWSRGQLGWSPWETVAGSLKHVSAGNDGAVWGVNAGDEVFRWTGSAWDPVAGGLKHVSAGNAANILGVNRNNAIYKWNGSGWTRISGALKHVSIAADGSAWGVNSDAEIFRWDGSAWEQVSGRLERISAGTATHVWGVNADDEIYRWNGNGWTQMAGALKHVSVAADGSVWGVNRNDEIFRGNGTTWEQIPGALKQISVGAAGMVWGVNKNDRIFRLR